MNINNSLTKFVFIILFGFLLLSYFSLKQNKIKDVRMDVQAAYCAPVGIYGGCSGTCPASYRCVGFDFSCECVLIPNPSNTPTPTPMNPCDGTANNSCDGANPISCVKTSCEYSKCTVGGATVTKCIECTQIGCSNVCHRECNVPDSIQCGYCPIGTSPTPTQPNPTCQPFSCHNTCGIPGCPAPGCGSQDGCGGTSCTPCGGGATLNPTQVAATPTVDPGCSPSCENDPCRTNLCSDQICVGTCKDNCVGALTCNVPVVTDFTIKNADTVIVGEDVNHRNHICENVFVGSSNSRRIILEANVHDEDGYTNISSVEITWAGIGYTMTFDNGSGNDALYTKTVDFGESDNNVNTWPIEIRIIDANDKTTGWITTGREFKVWDCQVQVSGSLYDGSSGQVCNNTGFTNLVDIDLNFRNLLF
ncbi:MAG: hypothetical protein WC503_02735, partial [Candidatus Shapirobacteria bacterium]